MTQKSHSSWYPHHLRLEWPTMPVIFPIFPRGPSSTGQSCSFPIGRSTWGMSYPKTFKKWWKVWKSFWHTSPEINMSLSKLIENMSPKHVTCHLNLQVLRCASSYMWPPIRIKLENNQKTFEFQWLSHQKRLKKLLPPVGTNENRCLQGCSEINHETFVCMQKVYYKFLGDCHFKRLQKWSRL